MIPSIFIVDDEAPARRRLTTLLADIAHECPHLLAGEAAHAQQALQQIAELQPDVVLLDVQMPGMDGLALAAQLVRSGSQGHGAPAIIFVTAFEQHALQAFDVHAVDYLLKPVRAERLAQALRRAAEWCDKTRLPASAGAHTLAGREHFSVQERGRILLVPVADVVYLKAELKYVTLRTRERDYLIEASLVSIEHELGHIFIRVHRNALVARAAICGVVRGTHAVDGDNESDKVQETWEVLLRGIDERLPISRRQWPLIRALVR
ncbi:MAG: DNA-binding response regulator [Gallionellales bacterium RBG_16_56_9]|nr:MAG: DNA-binding response regulator [Gallionellales bacterium RBG_16_56_9]